MLGWMIYISRPVANGSTPATEFTKAGVCLATWSASFDGPKWLDDLAKSNQAVDLGGNGYPCRYTALANKLLPHLIDKPFAKPDQRVISDDYLERESWQVKTIIFHEACKACPPDEWLLIEAWDES